MIKASIIGITGYTGLEQLRMLIAHPDVEIVHLTSRAHEDVAIGEVYPHLAHLDLRVSNKSHTQVAADSDVVFVALPHKHAQDVVADLHGKVKVIDHSADYRLDDAATYERYYQEHAHPALLSEVVYGVPEFDSAAIQSANVVANPGCFALLAQLMLHPLKDAIGHVDLMAVTGSSGSGKTASDGTHHPVRSHNMKSYNMNAHRHIPEIVRGAGIDEAQLNFVPTSGPFVRGIFASAFVRVNGTPKNADAVYKDAPFVRVCENVALAHVVGSNFCDVSYRQVGDDTYIVQGALDNLVKGAAGNALQCMNLMFGLDEGTGLNTLAPLYP